MKKYKLIKTYPGSPCFGTEIIEAADIKGKYFIKRSNIWFTNNPEKYPEFWENVIEKNYEILSFISTNTAIGEKEGAIRYINDDGYTVDEYLYNGESVKNGAYLIHSIKRLSDGEVFTIGDKIDCKGWFGNIIKFKIINNELKIFQQQHINNSNYKPLLIQELNKFKTPLFTTKDSVDIFKGDIVYFVKINKYDDWENHYITVVDETSAKNHIRFSTKEKAEEYVLMNEKSLSPNDILNVWSELSDYSNESLLKNSTLMTRIIKSIK